MSKFFAIAILLFFASGCASPSGNSTAKTAEPAALYDQAVYLVPNQGQLPSSVLNEHPEVTVVHSFEEFTQAVQTPKALWIDRDALGFIDPEWFLVEPQKYYPILAIGVNEPLCAFRDYFPGFGIEGPQVDCTQSSLQTGFSVWAQQKGDGASTQAILQGYEREITLEALFQVGNSAAAGTPVLE